MINTVSDIQNEVLVRASTSTTVAFITDEMLNDWTRSSYIWVAGFRKWPMTERRDNTTNSFNGTEEYSYPSDFKSDSIRLLQIASKRIQKLNHEDYEIFREEQSDSEDRVYTDHGRTMFINPNIDLSGTITAWGQYQPTIDPTDKTATTVFSNNEERLNEAMVEKMLSDLRKRQQKFQESQLHEQNALGIMADVWNKIGEEQYQYHTHQARNGMWKRIDVVHGGVTDELIRRDQFPI